METRLAAPSHQPPGSLAKRPPSSGEHSAAELGSSRWGRDRRFSQGRVAPPRLGQPEKGWALASEEQESRGAGRRGFALRGRAGREAPRPARPGRRNCPPLGRAEQLTAPAEPGRPGRPGRRRRPLPHGGGRAPAARATPLPDSTQSPTLPPPAPAPLTHLPAHDARRRHVRPRVPGDDVAQPPHVSLGLTTTSGRWLGGGGEKKK